MCTVSAYSVVAAPREEDPCVRPGPREASQHVVGASLTTDRPCVRPVEGRWPASECCRNRARPAGQAWRGLWVAALRPQRQAVRSGRRTSLLMSTEPAPWPQGHPDALVLDGGAVLTLGRLGLPETASEMPKAAEPPPPGPVGPVRGGGQLLEMSYLF